MPLIDPSTGQPDASGVMVNVSVKSYALANYAGIPVGLRDKFAHEPLFPKFALVLFDRMLGPAFILTGIMLIIGLGTRLSLLAQAMLFIALTVGLVLIDQTMVSRILAFTSAWSLPRFCSPSTTDLRSSRNGRSN